MKWDVVQVINKDLRSFCEVSVKFLCVYSFHIFWGRPLVLIMNLPSWEVPKVDMLYQECSSYLPPVATGYTLCRCPGASFRIFLATTLKGEASTPYNWVFWGETLQGKWDIPPWEKENHLQKSLGNRIFVSSQQFQQRSWFFWGRHIGISDIFIRPSTPSFLGGTTINHQSVPINDVFPRNWLWIYDIHFFLVDCLYICLGLGTLCWCNLFYSNVALIHTLP